MAFIGSSGMGAQVRAGSRPAMCTRRAAGVVMAAGAGGSSNHRENPFMMPPDTPVAPPGREEPSKAPFPMPMVAMGEGQMDVFSRLAKDRILLLGRQVDDEVANALVAQMLYLAADDPSKDITLYINSPGGSVSAGLAIYDTMQYIPCDVQTICFGTAASMGAFLLGAGAKGKRKSLPNARIMIHQPLGGAQGQAADIEIQAKEILWIKEVLNMYMSEYTGKELQQIEKDTDRDFFMTPAEAKEYGIIDEVIETKVSGKFLMPPRKELV
ncbi:ATP-dependent Clp protease proteolytic subunit 1 [Porphyridium purpureum]|uniref:ATP-dependent Clp protease proteolytic subunit n=1 Tax=Porphyridium purpureum TaxID=35688 RepID=A0A5J4YL26_PORPP|nr:ATP-dependent Clp protease proteolytic subunit 1 [Porphyridium purpureum]|eukprot:POR7827..scf244_11